MRVLVIDDDPTFGKLLSLHLTRQGHEVTVAEDGIQGQRVARQQLPGVIFIDYQMPAASGVVVAQRIASSSDTQHIPVIIVTGTAVEDVPAEVFEAGAVKVLSKLTLTEDDLARSLEEAMASNSSPDHEERAMLFPGEQAPQVIQVAIPHT